MKPHLLLLTFCLLMASSAHALPGDLDPSFGTGGKVVTSIGSGDSGGNAVARQSDGKIVVAGWTTVSSSKDFCVVRYNTDGTPDDGGAGDSTPGDSFGSGGKATSDFGAQDEALGVAVQADGKIIAVGVSFTPGPNTGAFALARYNTDGTPDTGFGASGTGRLRPVIGITSSGTKATGVRVQPDGKIVVVGVSLTVNLGYDLGYDMVVLRYNTNGTLDDGGPEDSTPSDSFGTGGLAIADLGNGDYGQDVQLMPDGRIVVCGYGTAYSSAPCLLSRFNADGILDTTFGGSGKVSVTGDAAQQSMSYCTRIALQADGKVVLAGMSQNENISLRRYNADGTRDTSFGSGGVVTTPVGTAQDIAYDVQIQTDGRIVVVGSAHDANTNFHSFALARYSTSGVLDSSFQSTGKVTTPFAGGNAYGRAVAIASDGRIIVAGYAHDGTKNNIALAQYQSSGSLATTAPAHGTRTNDSTPLIGGQATAGFTVSIYVDGNLAGSTTADGAGVWTFTSALLADGTHTAAATETDGFGSTSPLSNVVSFTVDTTAPEAPVITSPAENTLVGSGWPVISGTAEAGATVTVHLDGSAAGTSVAGVAGNWSFTPGIALANGVHTVRAIATDAAGNPSGFSGLITFSTIAAIFGGPGTLDPSFGLSGKVTTQIGGTDSGGHALARQSDGKIVVAGWTTVSSSKDFCVVRYNTDGTLDDGGPGDSTPGDSFGSGGKATSDFGAQDEALGVAVQADGKIIAVGVSFTPGPNYSYFALARYNADGTPDTGFGVTGTGRLKPVIGLVSSGTKATGVRVQPDGKFVVVGVSLTVNLGYDFGYDMVVLRYNSDGTLDNGFGTGGLAIADLGNADYGQDVQLMPDGRIVVCGYGTAYSSAPCLMARFQPDGQLDTTFGGTGKVSVLSGVQQQYMSFCTRIALQADGKVVLAGMSQNENISLRRYNVDGTHDTTFGVNGVVTTPVGTAQDQAYDVAVQPDGRVLVAGYSHDANTNYFSFAVVRYSASGLLDTSFQSTGKVTTPFPGGSAYGKGMIIAPDGRIIVTGYAHDGTKNNIALIRLFGTDQPPIVTTGDATGIVRNGAVLNGTVNPNSLATTAYYEYGTTTSYGSTSATLSLGSGYLATAAVSTIGGLTDNTLYHYRLVATNAAGTTYGADATFTTAPNPPLAFTGDAANVSASGATLIGVVLPNGRDTTAYFEFGLSTAYGAQTDSQLVPSTAVIENVFAPLTGLIAGATYHFRLVAINAGSPIPITGVDKTFVAQAPPPVVTLAAALPLTTSSAILSGTVNPNNISADVFFDYGTSAGSFTQSVVASPASVSGAVSVPVNGVLTGLAQGVTYHYRLRAVSAGGTTVSATRTFQMDLLLGLQNVFPEAPEPTEGFLVVNLAPSGILHGWRFSGEQQWRASGVASGGLSTGNREIEFRPVPGYIHPLPTTVSVVSGEPATVVTELYFETPTAGTGGISVTLKPDSITTGTNPAQWRMSGENDTQWRDSAVTVSDLPAGSYLIECKAVPGRATPLPVNVIVSDGVTSTPVITYFLPDSPTGTAPTVLAFESVTSDTSKPYAFVGQLRSHSGSATGFVVKERVVATAAHVVWDDYDLVAVEGLQWLFQRHRGLNEPDPVFPRGFYTFTGYTDQRELENTPGEFSPQSQHLDVAAIYFNEAAGRNGYGGYLASDLSNNEFLLSSANKMLVGYPVDGIPAASQGRMHATTTFNAVFNQGYNHPVDGVRTFITNDIRSTGGNSGGPLCVQFNGGSYFPAAIYLGGSNQTVVRAIDSQVIELFERAEDSGYGGPGNTGGGITHTSTTTISAGSSGSVKVIIEPAGARDAGAGWRLAPDTYRVSGLERRGLSPGTYILELIEVAGYDAPAPSNVVVTAGQLQMLTYTYNTPQESWRQVHFGSTANSGDGADAFDFDGDGFTNAAEYAAGTNPKLSSDRLLAHNPQRGANSFSVTTDGKSGRTYYLERSINLSGWSTVASQGPLSFDASVTLTDATSPSGAGFYRIRVTGPTN